MSTVKVVVKKLCPPYPKVFNPLESKLVGNDFLPTEVEKMREVHFKCDWNWKDGVTEGIMHFYTSTRFSELQTLLCKHGCDCDVIDTVYEPVISPVQVVNGNTVEITLPSGTYTYSPTHDEIYDIRNVSRVEVRSGKTYDPSIFSQESPLLNYLLIFYSPVTFVINDISKPITFKGKNNSNRKPDPITTSNGLTYSGGVVH